MKNLTYFGIAIAVFALAPIFMNDAVLYMLGLAFIFTVYCVSWDVIAGYTGQVNLGHTVFIGIGAYTTALLSTSRIPHPEMPVFLTIFIGGIVATFFGLTIGAVCLRLKGYYLALVTAILPLIFIQLTNIYSGIFGGYEGFSIPFSKSLPGGTLGNYYISLVFCFSCLLAMYIFVNTNIGVKLRAVRDDEELAEAVGIDVVKYKLIAFCVSAFFAGLAGALAVHYKLTVGVDFFSIPLMLEIILGVIAGGIGTFYGGAVGGFLIYIAENWIFIQLASYVNTFLPFRVSDEMILYILLIVLIIIFPQGIITKIAEFLSGIDKSEIKIFR
jgi:branched-chain amino acid transport system permease protein